MILGNLEREQYLYLLTGFAQLLQNWCEKGIAAWFAHNDYEHGILNDDMIVDQVRGSATVDSDDSASSAETESVPVVYDTAPLVTIDMTHPATTVSAMPLWWKYQLKKKTKKNMNIYEYLQESVNQT